jgi:cell wall-associated NlpC family hydrolase
MTVALYQDLPAPVLAGWQKVADCYGLRAYVFRAAGKIFAVTNEEQAFGELVTS